MSEQYQSMGQEEGQFNYAGFWRRFLAYIIDGLIISVFLGIVYAILGQDFLNAASFLGSWLYFSLMESSAHQATLGKKLLGIIVVDYEKNRISFGQATGRYFAKILSSLILLIGYIMVAFTERKQGLHDILAKTLVINQ